jgi:predicted nucleic acid-binding Zn finger protein
MKRYVGPRNSYGWGSGSREHKIEESVLKQACQQISRTHAISDDVKNMLVKAFDRNFVEAMKLVDQNRVKQVRFAPSGRVIWVVTGRKREYQVVPQSMFCTCDDYYFRVLGRKKQLCYHLIAQHLAEALGLQSRSDLVDADYTDFTARWKPGTGSERT